jgi:hypothetical protein
MKFIHGLKMNHIKIIYINFHLLSKYQYFKLQCHLIMMDSEIVKVGKNMMMRLEFKKKLV